MSATDFELHVEKEGGLVDGEGGGEMDCSLRAKCRQGASGGSLNNSSDSPLC